MRTRLPAALSVIAVLAVVGCGSSKGGSSGTVSSGVASAGPSTPAPSPKGPALSLAQLRARADAICAQVNRRFVSKKNVIRSQADAARAASERAAVEQAALAKLHGLAPPTQFAPVYNELLLMRTVLAEDTSKLGKYAAAGAGQQEAPLFVSSNAVLQQLEQYAQKNGFHECGRLGGAKFY